MLLYSETHDFLDHYFLPASNTSILDEVVKQLRRKRVLIHRPKLPMAKTSTPTQHPAATTSNYRLSGSESQEQPFPLVLREFVNRASEGRMTRSQSSVEKLWTKLENLATDIRQCMETAGVQCTGLELSLLPDSRSDSGDDIEDAISESFVETDGQRSGHKPSSYASLDMIVPVAVRVNGECIAQNREQLMRAMSDILEGDIARNFTYGISIEDDCVSLWYSTRKTTIKATSFSYIERPDLLIRVFVSLFSADREALGYESHITRLADGSYLYELDGITAKADDLQSSQRLRSKAVPKRGHTFFFKTTHLVSKGHTRIWKAVEVISKSNPKAKPRCREIILKDTWVDADTVTEFDLQVQLFHDIDVLKQSDWESLPILSCIPRDRPEFVRLRGYLQDDTYKSLFLQYDGRMRYTSPSEKSFPSEKVWKASNTHPPTGSPEPRMGTTRPDPPDSKPPSVSPKKRYLPSLGDAMSVLNQAYFALLIMFCAGWVHRDISDGNILAIEVDGKWAAKLADLEFAKKLSPNAGSPDPKIGTPYFMAYEIQSSRHICHMIRIDQELPIVWDPEFWDPEPEGGQLNARRGEHWGKVRHTFLHDVESLWWLILWIITSRVGCEPSRAAAKEIFQVTSTPTITRSDSLCVGIPRNVTSSLHDGVKLIASALEHFRARLYHDYCRNIPEMRLDYINLAPICALPLVFFHNIEAFHDVWGVLPVRQPWEAAEAARLRTQTVQPSAGPKRQFPSAQTSVSLEYGNNEDQPGLSKRRRTHSRRGAKAGRKAWK